MTQLLQGRVVQRHPETAFSIGGRAQVAEARQGHMGNARDIATFGRVFEGLHPLLMGCTVVGVKPCGGAREGNASLCHKPTYMIRVHVSDVDLVDLFRLATSRQSDTKKNVLRGELLGSCNQR